MTRTIGSRRQQQSMGRFVGRTSEQQAFRSTLKRLADLQVRTDDQLSDNDIDYAQIFLIAAEGGMGKTTLLNRFKEITSEFNDHISFQSLLFDFDKFESITQPEQFMNMLHER